MIQKLKTAVQPHIEVLQQKIKAFKPIDYAIMGTILLAVILIFPPTRNLIVDSFNYHIKDSFHADTKYFFERGVNYAEKGKSMLAVKTFKRTIRNPQPNDPYFAESLYNIGVIYYTLGQSVLQKNRKKAIGLFQTAAEYWETFRQYYANVKVASFEEKIKNIADAQTYIDSLDENPKAIKARELKNQGQKAFYMNDLPLALEFYKKAIEVDPTYDTVYNNIGAVYFYMKQYTNTVKYWERAVLLDPKENKELFLSLGGVYEQFIGDLEKALFYYTEHLKYNPKDPQKNEIKKQIKNIKEQLKSR